ncbi:uncharacterized protein KY384_007112 [Bacidia gigantensis]|uniref:uncharacterized protein n=1 Tax=Bacidia gigantensis TaxID=2732470 RepID=UPI001D03784B|nr:uncharacterized protein KY384_007112 [Bacidia gigantensis]KAG8528195.1 hypothetical protein KY384_007112 [Bacidia gigantensis]
MPRGAEYAGAPPASDNAIEAGETKAHGVPHGDADGPSSSGVDRSNKAAPLPEGISEMKDQNYSGGGSQGLTGQGSGKGKKDPASDVVAENLKEKV